MATSSLIKEFERAGQGHVFAFYNDLSSQEQQALLAEAAEIDLAEVDHLTRTLLSKDAGSGLDLSGLSPAWARRWRTVKLNCGVERGPSKI